MRTAPLSLPAATSRTHVKLPKWSEDDKPHEYFQKFEKAMKRNSVDQTEWGHVLPIYLTGRAQTTYSQVPEETLDDYEALKHTMLETLGDTPASADREWWTLSRRSGETAGEYRMRIQALGTRRMHGLETKEEIKEMMVLSHFMSTLPPDCYTCVSTQQPKTSLQAAKFVQDFEEVQTFSRRNQSWKAGKGSHDTGYKREQSYGNSGSGSSSGSSGIVSNSSSSVSTHDSSSQGNTSKNQASGGVVVGLIRKARESHLLWMWRDGSY